MWNYLWTLNVSRGTTTTKIRGLNLKIVTLKKKNIFKKSRSYKHTLDLSFLEFLPVVLIRCILFFEFWFQFHEKKLFVCFKNTYFDVLVLLGYLMASVDWVLVGGVVLGGDVGDGDEDRALALPSPLFVVCSNGKLSSSASTYLPLFSWFLGSVTR